MVFLKLREYDRKSVIKYAKKWAHDRNPKYYNFDNVGGDCTAFASQCIYEGVKIMNYNTNGWFYKNANNKHLPFSYIVYDEYVELYRYYGGRKRRYRSEGYCWKARDYCE